MPNLYEILADAQHGDAMASLGESLASRRSKLRPRWRRCCQRYPWASSDPPRHLKGLAICSP